MSTPTPPVEPPAEPVVISGGEAPFDGAVDLETVASKLKGGRKRKIAQAPADEDVGEEFDPNAYGIIASSLDESMHYRLVFDGQQRLARIRTKGYRPVSRTEDGVRMTVDVSHGAEEDLIRIGDCILMCCPKHLRERRERKALRAAADRLRVPELEFKSRAEVTGPDGVEVVKEK